MSFIAETWNERHISKIYMEEAASAARYYQIKAKLDQIEQERNKACRIYQDSEKLLSALGQLRDELEKL